MNLSSVDYLFNVLEQYEPIPEEEKAKVIGKISVHKHLKNDHFIRQGDKPSSLALISAGIFRVYCITESGEEKTIAFRKPGQFIAAYTPYLTGRVCWYSIESLTCGEIVSVPISVYSDLSAGHHCWNKIINKLILDIFIEKEEREHSFLTMDAAKRYLKFKSSYPEIERLVPQYYIASYLGISPVSLSRIRKNLKE